MTGDSFHILEIDLPIAFVLAAPWLIIASTRKSRNAPLVVPAVMLFVLGVSSLYVALVEDPSTAHSFRNLNVGSEWLQHHQDLFALAVSTLAAATLLFVLGLLVWDVLTTGIGRRHVPAVFTIFAAAYGACTIWLLVAAHQGANLAKHVSQHAPP